MKSLEEFKTNLSEDRSEYSKFDLLIRAGLANKSQINRIHKILDKMKEDRPVFNPMERVILQNIFNKMVNLISNNKQIFQQTRRAVREESEEFDESIVATSDYKLGPAGRKVRAHRIQVGKTAPKVGDELEPELNKEDVECIEENRVDRTTPPFVLVLRRKAIRMYPEGTRVALYYNERLNRYFSVPYSSKNLSRTPIAAEEYDSVDSVIQESVMDTLYKITEERQSQTVNFASGHIKNIDYLTASAITEVYESLNNNNKNKLLDMVQKSPEHFQKATDFAFKHKK